MIPINDLKRGSRALREELEKAIGRVLDSGWYCLGPEVEAFEQEFAEYCGARGCVTVNSGTDALELALRALDVGRDDPVLTAANAGGYATAAILALGAKPVFADVDSRSLTLDPAALSDNLKPGIRAIIVTHLYGRLAAVEELADIARQRSVPLIEDCAQAHGARRHGKHCGCFGDIGCFSFYPTKNLGALGDSGALVVNDPALKRKLIQLRQYGWSSKYVSDSIGGRNSRMDEIQAAVLRTKLPYLERQNARRTAIAQKYCAAFSSYNNLEIPLATGQDNVFHLFVLRHGHRDLLRVELGQKGIGTDIHYPVPDYNQLNFTDRYSGKYSLPITEMACRQVFSIPCFPEMDDCEVDRVIEAISQVAELTY